MKDNLIDILVYVFEQYLTEQPEGFASLNNKELAGKLVDVGFKKEEIDQAFTWLDDLVDGTNAKFKLTTPVSSYRVFTQKEKAQIPMEARSLLMRLEQAGVFDVHVRELVIDRLMALESNLVDIDDVRWVIMMVLCNQSDFPEEIEWAESLVTERRLNIQ
jgi:Smg protein